MKEEKISPDLLLARLSSPQGDFPQKITEEKRSSLEKRILKTFKPIDGSRGQEYKNDLNYKLFINGKRKKIFNGFSSWKTKKKAMEMICYSARYLSWCEGDFEAEHYSNLIVKELVKQKTIEIKK